MRSMICGRLRIAASAATKSVIEKGKGGRWRNVQTRSSMSELRGCGGDGKRSVGMAEAIRSWEQLQKRNYSMKHQEIEGPTVERDMSEVAKEARQVTESMLKSMYGVSKAVAVLGITQLGVGAYMSNMNMNMNMNTSVLSMGVCAVAFGFPFSMALMMRQSLKSMHFFNKMEQMGRLQLMTSNMQISKHLRLFFLRLRILTYTSLSALFLSFLYSLSTSTSTSTPVTAS